MEFCVLVEEFRYHCLKVGCAMVAIEQFFEKPHVNVRGNIKSPHKFILILSILEIMDEDVDHPNQFKFEEIEPVFQKLFDDFYPSLPKSKKALEFHFVHLQHERFWLLKVKDRDYDEN